MFSVNKPAARRRHEVFRSDLASCSLGALPGRRISGAALAGFCLFALGCPDKAASPPPSAAPTSAPVAAPSAPAPAAPPSTGAPADPAAAPTGAPTVLKPSGYFEKPTTCEIEFEGKVTNVDKLPPKHRFWIFVAQGKADCLDPAAYIIGRTVASPVGEFSFEVFSDWGQDITFCAAALPGQDKAEGMDKPSKLYGKATGSYHAEASGEIVWKSIDIAVKPGPAHVFPALKAPLAGKPAK